MTEYTDSKKDQVRYTPKDCKVFEMVQYQCEANIMNIECTPFVRLFLRCSGAPTVEVTPEYNEFGESVSNILPTMTKPNQQ